MPDLNELAAKLVEGHLGKLEEISQRDRDNQERWGSVTQRLAERFVNTGQRVSEILDELAAERPKDEKADTDAGVLPSHPGDVG